MSKFDVRVGDFRIRDEYPSITITRFVINPKTGTEVERHFGYYTRWVDALTKMHTWLVGNGGEVGGLDGVINAINQANTLIETLAERLEAL